MILRSPYPKSKTQADVPLWGERYKSRGKKKQFFLMVTVASEEHLYTAKNHTQIGMGEALCQ